MYFLSEPLSSGPIAAWPERMFRRGYRLWSGAVAAGSSYFQCSLVGAGLVEYAELFALVFCEHFPGQRLP